MFTNTVGAALFASNIEREEAAKRPHVQQQEETESYRSLVIQEIITTDVGVAVQLASSIYRDKSPSSGHSTSDPQPPHVDLPAARHPLLPGGPSPVAPDALPRAADGGRSVRRGHHALHLDAAPAGAGVVRRGTLLLLRVAHSGHLRDRRGVHRHGRLRTRVSRVVQGQDLRARPDRARLPRAGGERGAALALPARAHVVLPRERDAAPRAAGRHAAAEHDPGAGQRHVRVAQRHAHGVGGAPVLLRDEGLRLRAAEGGHRGTEAAVLVFRDAGDAARDDPDRRRHLHVHERCRCRAVRCQHREGAGEAGAAQKQQVELEQQEQGEQEQEEPREGY
ncbi:hypothetical protein ON010_g17923 [Phytophthora cinnamomi]|nr:hypothetical protein ON010_g17923 [Phytophthora cinnamomi]